MLKLAGQFLLLTGCLVILQSEATDWPEEHQDHHLDHKKYQNSPPKDRVLLRELSTLTFIRNKRTTSKRTHSIHQLSCVGGTAGCKLFTPDLVECKNAGFDHDKQKIIWKCHADISDRVTINHVDVICEGYDYAEDDYILLGSCGLEFSLDYVNDQDYHDKSYFKHLDNHEKELHQKKSSPSTATKQAQGFMTVFSLIVDNLMDNMLLICSFLAMALCSLLIVRFLSRNNRTGSSNRLLTSAVMTTKKIT